MAWEVGTWNAHNSLGDPEKAGRAAEVVLRMEPDVFFIAEAGKDDERSSDVLAAVAERFRNDGLETWHQPYGDIDGRKDTHQFMAVARDAAAIGSAWMGTRNASKIVMRDRETGRDCLFDGAHLDDRSKSTRLMQLAELGLSTLPEGLSVVVYGDLNNTHAADPWPRRFGKFGAVAAKLPTIDPGEWHELPKAKKLLHLPGRVGSLAVRSVEMANGEVMERLAEYGFQDFDSLHRPTKGKLQLDHITGKNVTLVPGSFRVHSSEGLSDHRPISATVAPAEA